VLTKLEVRTEIPILFAATVGEEALGNLRGVRHLFAENRDKIRYFISLDGAGIEQITNRALGSKRYKIEVEGPGGHSWGDFGIVNPIQALGRAIHKMLSYKPPKHPRTSYNIGIISGGKSVNSIPQKASFEIDLRSISHVALQELEQYMINAIETGVLEENEHAQFRHSLLQLKINLIGERPSGEIPQNSKIVKTAMDATLCLGATPVLDCASTDANIPISIGVEAVTLGAGGSCGSCHTTQEWFNPESRSTSLKRTLLLILALAGMKKSY
jgi:acetylornithine deacetylase/succinyl-diaminopimelate desuccinylase-like protein